MPFRDALVTIEHYWDLHGDATVNIGNTIRLGVDQSVGQNKIAIVESVEAIAKAIELLAHGEGVDIFCGVLMVLSGIATLNPTTGPYVGSVLKLASVVIHNFCGSGDQVGAAVLSSINQALERFADAELRAKVAGTVQVYKTSFAFLSVGNHDLIRNDEVATIMANVPIYAGVEFLGILQHKIEDLRDCTDKKEAYRAIEYINMYVKLAVLRHSLIQSLYNIVVQTQGGENIAERIRNVINTEKDADRTLLGFLIRPEDYSHKLLLSCLYISTIPNLGKYLQHLGVQRRRVGTRTFSFDTGEFTIGLTRAWFFNPFNDGFVGSIKGNQSEYEFTLEEISEDDSLFYIRSAEEPRVYIYMENSPFAQCSASKSRPGPEGEWKVIKFRHNGGHIFSTKKWPEWFLKGDQEDNKPNLDSPYSSDTINYSVKGDNSKYSVFWL